MRSLPYEERAEQDQQRRIDSDKVHVDLEPGFPHLFGQPELPRLPGVKRHVPDAVEIRGNLNLLFMEDADSTAAQLPYKVPKLQGHVLPGAWPEGLGVSVNQPARIFRREENHGEPDIHRVVLELLDERSSLVGLLLEDDRVEPELTDEASHSLSRAFLPPVDELGAVRRTT